MFGIICWAISVFVTVRLFQLVKVLCRLLRLHVIYPKLGWTFDLEPFKEMWVVGAGVTDGIGKAYLNEIAEKGFRKFALIGRNRKKLDGLQRFLSTKYKAEVKIFTFDFSSTDYAGMEAFIGELGEVGMLLNFVGQVAELVGKFCEHSKGSGSKMFTVNTMGAVKLMETVLPGMAARDSGVIVNVSSITGHRPVPLIGAYSASKAALSFFSESLAQEYNSKTLRIQCLTPGPVATKLTPKARADGKTIMDVNEYAASAVDIIGLDSYATGSIVFEVQLMVFQLLPFWITKYAIGPIIKRQAAAYGMDVQKDE